MAGMGMGSIDRGGSPQRPGMSQADIRRMQLLVVAVFFLFGGITNINDVLIPKLKGLFQLSYMQANLVQFAFFTSYAIFSIPAGLVMKKLGYVRGVVLGFAIMALACVMFLPATYSGQYISFLVALFMIGGGITLLQVAVNPLILQLGPAETAHSRLTFAQLFNSIGVFVMVYGGAELILGDSTPVDATGLSAASLKAIRVQETAIIGQAYLGLAVVLTAIAAFFWLWRKALDGQAVEDVKLEGTFALLRRPRLAFGVLCIFMYVGAEVGIGSNLVSYLGDERVLGLSQVEAGRLLALYWLGALVGRLAGTVLLRLVKPGLVLLCFAAAAIALIATSALSSGALAAWTLIAVGLANSIMFPTIFSLATEGMTAEAPQASGLLCTAIVGGAIVPVLIGFAADNVGLAAAMLVPIACYAVIASFGIYAMRSRAAA
ncbi:MAG: sugar MFS transporter [Blastomonas fulva]|uniref:sugar MFS transporter n=1 Tax=Blastomonas fulva TaxID=1550728 RepID=UPI0040345599